MKIPNKPLHNGARDDAHRSVLVEKSVLSRRESSASDPSPSRSTKIAFGVANTTKNAPFQLSLIRDNILGYKHVLNGPFGTTPMVYADATASGKSLAFIEDYIQNVVLPMYANTHTESSATGSQTTFFREQARSYVHEALGVPSAEYAVVFAGSGSTGAMNKLAGALGISPMAPKKFHDQPVVFISYYEHHSNELLWRESNVETIVIPEDPETGSLDVAVLESMLIKHKNRRLKLGSFSAASNVSGIVANVEQITALLHRYNAVAAWDFAAAGPHTQIDVKALGIDALYLSTHKYVGGPQTPGILVARRSLFTNSVPTIPGGGTVNYVQPNTHEYLDEIELREEGGTPAIVESIRAGLVLKLHHQVKHNDIEAIEQRFLRKALDVWACNPNIVLLGNPNASKRVPITSFLMKVADKYLHYNLVVALLNDLFGIQSRGGCACAGPYGHILLNISQEHSDSIINEMQLSGNDSIKPGWTRLSFKYYMSESTVDYLINAVDLIAREGYKLIPWYKLDSKSGIWRHCESFRPMMSLWDFENYAKPNIKADISLQDHFRKVKTIFATLNEDDAPVVGSSFEGWTPRTDALCWFVLPKAEA